MSWDLVMIRTKTNTEEFDEIEEENILPFTRREIVDELKTIAEELSVECVVYDDVIQIMDRFSLNVYIDDINESVMLCVYGEDPGIWKRLADDLGARICDCGSGEFMDFEKPSGFERWKAYKDKLVENEQ